MQRALKNSLRVIPYAVAAGLILLLVSQYVNNYSNIDGLKLANGRVIGGDYLTFYLAGSEVSKGRSGFSSLYDWEANLRLQETFREKHQLDEGNLPFIYPPLVACVFYLVFLESYIHSYLLWTFISLLCFSSSILILSLDRENQVDWGVFGKLVFFSLAFYPFSLECIGAGQTSAIGLFVFSLVYHFLKNGSDFNAGLALSLSYYKPPLFLFFVLLAFARGHWRFIQGFLLGGAVLVSLSWILAGDVFFQYIIQATGYRYGESIDGNFLPPEKGVGLLAGFTQAVPSATKIFQLGLLFILLAFTYLFRNISKRAYLDRGSKLKSFELNYALEVSLSLLLSLQMVVYDLSILILPISLVFLRATKFRPVFFAVVSLLYFEFLYRNVEIGGVSIKLTAILFALFCFFLFWEEKKVKKQFE